MADVMKVVTDAEAVYADVQAQNVTKAIADGETLVTDLKQAITDCKQSSILKARDSAKCIADVEKLAQDA